MPNARDIEAFLAYSDKKYRERFNLLTEDEQKEAAMLELRNSIQECIEISGKQDQIFADIQNGTLVIINTNNEVIYTWDKSDPDYTIKLIKIVGTGL